MMKGEKHEILNKALKILPIEYNKLISALLKNVKNPLTVKLISDDVRIENGTAYYAKNVISSETVAALIDKGFAVMEIEY